jgi:hypothetical protein
VSVAESRVLRVFRFRPTTPEFDADLRKVLLPDLIDLPGIIEAYAGRRGDPAPDDRIVASLWVKFDAMASALGEDIEASPFHPEFLGGSTDRTLLTCALDFGDRVDSDEEVRVLRLAEGTVRAGELDEYAKEARAGMIADRASGRGPTALYLARTGSHSFVTLSLWPDWPTLQEATSGNIHQPIATRHADRLVDWTASHYEVITPEPR